MDELLGESLFNVGKGRIPKLLRQNQGSPVYVSIIKVNMYADNHSLYVSFLFVLHNSFIYMGVKEICILSLQCKMSDGSVFPPIAELLKRAGPSYTNLQSVLKEEEERMKSDRMPPHAILPEDEEDEIPVHSATDRHVT